MSPAAWWGPTAMLSWGFSSGTETKIISFNGWFLFMGSFMSSYANVELSGLFDQFNFRLFSERQAINTHFWTTGYVYYFIL